MSLPKIAYSMRGLPVDYWNVTYKDTKLSMAKAEELSKKIAKAPAKGILLVSGTCAPIVNQLIDAGRKVLGLSFPEYYQSKLSNEESMEIPRGSTIVIYGIGAEPANSPQFASKILGALLSSYKSSLVILETDKTPSNFQTTYSLVLANTVSVPEADVVKWV